MNILLVSCSLNPTSRSRLLRESAADLLEPRRQDLVKLVGNGAGIRVGYRLGEFPDYAVLRWNRRMLA